MYRERFISSGFLAWLLGRGRGQEQVLRFARNDNAGSARRWSAAYGTGHCLSGQRLEAVDVDDSLGKVIWSFLGQVVADAAGDDAVGVLA